MKQGKALGNEDRKEASVFGMQALRAKMARNVNGTTCRSRACTAYWKLSSWMIWFDMSFLKDNFVSSGFKGNQNAGY
jgi:hypothetical protein